MESCGLIGSAKDTSEHLHINSISDRLASQLSISPTTPFKNIATDMENTNKVIRSHITNSKDIWIPPTERENLVFLR